ncbi:GNAT family N-acetyltransferase [Cohnella faecalis]|uniref:N-acetyltransferase family protein n=1 Tax=Cohnella faecalis TaxID=2315694 RepID=A0A398CKX2_9BACL|nr:GNAT family N-acetyltransferase [Cohnella faecalis]RIE01869.1 N-acetyltransferase family protein [Cohnella faecalis]RIE04920.1 N-acetyltransferase family protein [Cohnella faecalis]
MIREALERDLPAILDIYNDAILNTTAVYTYEAQTLSQREQWFCEKREAGYPVLVFEADGEAAGFATFGPFRAWPAYKYTIEHSIYAHGGYRQRGIGTALLKELIRIAEERGYKTLVAGIDESNDASVRMHVKHGFSHAGTIRNAGYKFGRWLNLAFYEYELAGPSHPVEK